ncbi:unnamed protein product [Heterobilharzia americana]|nr:unnamed protein product [Heterobilharzia americana]
MASLMEWGRLIYGCAHFLYHESLMEFKTIEGAEKAIETMHRFEVGDRKLVVREETARDAARIASMEVDGALPNDPANSVECGNVAGVGPVFTPHMLSQMGIEGPITDSVYVSNLDYSVTWQKLKDVFKQAGKVVSCVIKTDSEGNSRGIGILKFSHPYEAVQAVSMFNNQILKDRPMRVKIDRQGTPASSGVLYPPSQRTGSSGILGSTTSVVPSGSVPAEQQSSNVIAALLTLLGLKANADSSSQGGILEILRTLSSNANLSGCSTALAPTGSSNSPLNLAGHSLSMSNASQGMNRLSSNQLSEDGLQTTDLSSYCRWDVSVTNSQRIVNPWSVSGNYHIDSRTNKQDFYNGGSVMKCDPSDILIRGGYSRSSRGYDEDSLQYDNNRRQMTQKLVVKNLPFSFTNHDVKRIFREVGDMSYCNLVTDSDGHSQGIAFITYTNPECIRRAIDLLNGKMFDGRRIRLHAE